MKLYYAPYTCSLSPHIVLRELDLPFELVKVDNKTKQTADGRDFYAINPKGYVAALELDSGEVLTEGPAIVQYLADQKPDKDLAPPAGTWARVRLQEWLNFITSEIHAGSAPLFNAALPEEAKVFFREKLFKRFEVLETALQQQPYLLGSSFSVADAYLFTVLSWCKFFAIDLGRWPAIATYSRAIGRRPSVQTALRIEATQ
ncbi:glutathione transferase GstA [Acidovorax sp. SUPP2522]|uniref:glutathione transferase GstA n=1 Tax=unclassified Acidovorax TaxID=2684926 RepID=UPI00234C01D0|nr:MULTISPECIES: glutathione transferase GstA [unclassified Acidovorax]WCM99617.1 glutathione transferase GstA [Acidovorax sp. GBBC 1281]GKT18277.1 glutathione transferase GstA [Acidovorax sp. SUPP2522]